VRATGPFGIGSFSVYRGWGIGVVEKSVAPAEKSAAHTATHANTIIR